MLLLQPHVRNTGVLDCPSYHDRAWCDNTHDCEMTEAPPSLLPGRHPVPEDKAVEWGRVSIATPKGGPTALRAQPGSAEGGLRALGDEATGTKSAS